MYSSVIINSTPSLRRVSSNSLLTAVDRFLDGPGDAYLLVLPADGSSNAPRRAYMRTHPHVVHYANNSGNIEYTGRERPYIRVSLTDSELHDYFEAVKLKTNTHKYFACPTAPYVPPMHPSAVRVWELTSLTELPTRRSLKHILCLSRRQSTSHALHFFSATVS